MKVRLELDDRAGTRFFEAELQGSRVVMRSGRVGKRERTSEKVFTEVDEAREHLDLVAGRFLAKGFVRPGEGPACLPSDASGMTGFEIPWSVAVERAGDRLGAEAVSHIRRLALCSQGDSVLWIDEPWAEIEYDALAAQGAVALAVFAAPVHCDGPLILSAEMLLGDASARNDRAFVFLDEVTAEALTTLPDTWTFFAGGLQVETAACFSATDATSWVSTRLNAPTVVSGNGDGWVRVLPGTTLEVQTACRYIEGVDPHPQERELTDIYPRWANRLEDESAWELFVEAFDEGKPVEPG